MSDEYLTSAVIRWGDDGQVMVLWELQGSTYGFTVAPEMFDEMLLEGSSIEDSTMAPVVMNLMVFS